MALPVRGGVALALLVRVRVRVPGSCYGHCVCSVQVLSGDAVVIRGTPKRGPPPERILALSNIVAPRLARRPGQQQQQQQDSKDEVRVEGGREVEWR